MKLEHSLTLYTKINSKWIKDLNVRPDTIKLLEENTGKPFFDINHSKIFFDLPLRVMKIKTKINVCNVIKIKGFCTAKEAINKMKRWKNLHPRLLHPTRISFKIVGEIKSFTDNQKLREFSTTKPALQQMLKGLV